jgi:hypothetical protein
VASVSIGTSAQFATLLSTADAAALEAGPAPPCVPGAASGASLQGEPTSAPGRTISLKLVLATGGAAVSADPRLPLIETAFVRRPTGMTRVLCLVPVYLLIRRVDSAQWAGVWTEMGNA